MYIEIIILLNKKPQIETLVLTCLKHKKINHVYLFTNVHTVYKYKKKVCKEKMYKMILYSDNDVLCILKFVRNNFKKLNITLYKIIKILL